MCGITRNTRHISSILRPGTADNVIIPTGYYRKMTWGINDGKIYNAREENINSKWKTIQNNRCLWPVFFFQEGFKTFCHKDTTNFSFLTRKGKQVLYLAGIYSDNLNEFVVITKRANETVQPYHDRMPLILTIELSRVFLKGRDVHQLAKENINNIKILQQ